MSTKNARFLPKRTVISGRIPTGTTENEDNFIKQGELAVNTTDKKIFSYDGTNVFEFGSNSFLGLSGGTINGDFIVTGNTALNTLSATSIQFDTNPIIPGFSAGRAFYDNTWKTLAVQIGDDSTLQIGQEEIVYVFNNSGIDIPNGKVIYVTGAGGTGTTTQTITMAIATADTATIALGVTTQEIKNNQHGLVTVRGNINGLDTTAYGGVPGDELYLSDTELGALTVYPPSVPNYSVRIGRLLINDSSNGRISVTIVNKSAVFSSAFIDQLNVTDLSIGGNDIYGIFVSKLDETKVTGFTYDNANTLTIKDNQGENFSVSISSLSSITVNGDSHIIGKLDIDGKITASTVNANAIQSGGTDLYNIFLPVYNGSASLQSLTASTLYGNGSGITSINLNNTYGQLPLSSYTGSFIQNTIIVGKSGLTNFTSVKAAVDSITGASIANRYSIIVHPGTYIEDTITLKEFIDIKAHSYNSTIIEVNATNKNVLNAVGNVTLQGLIFKGSTDSGKAIFNLSSDMGMGKVLTCIACTAGNTNSILNSNLGVGQFGIIAFEGITGSYGNGFVSGFNISGDGYTVITLADSKNSVSNAMTNYVNISGVNNRVILTNFGVLVQSAFGGSLINFVNCYDGATVEAVAIAVDGCTTGINNEDIGVGCYLKLNDVNIINATTDLNIQGATTTGSFFGTAEYTKTNINPLNSFYVVNKDLKVVTVANKGGDFSSIAAAVNYITGSSEDNIYKIQVGAGTFIEPLIDLSAKPYISIVGSAIQTTIIIPDANNHDVISIGIENEISFLTILSAGTGYAGISALDGGDFAQMHKISFFDCDTCVKVTSLSQDTVAYLEYVDFNGVMSYGIYIDANNNFKSTVNAENFYTFPSASGFTAVYVTGPGSQFISNAAGIYGSENPGAITHGNIGVECQDGASVVFASTEVGGFDTGILNNNTGTGCTLSIAGSIFKDNDTYDIYIGSPFTTGGMIGTAKLTKLYIDSLSTFTPLFTNRDAGGGAVIVGDIYQGETMERLLNLSHMVRAEASTGLSTGGILNEVSGLTISVSAGTGYLYTTGGYIKEISWNATTLTLPSGTTRYILVDENAIVSDNAAKGDGIHSILLGSVYSRTANIHYIENTPLSIKLLGNRTIEFINEAFGVVYTTGSIVTENGTRQLNVTGGERYYNLDEFISTGGTPVFFEEHWKTDGINWRHGATTATTVDNSQYNPSSGLTAMTAGYYAKHSLYVTGEGSYEQYLLVYAQSEHSGLTETIAANLPTPPTEFLDSTCVIASIITKQGTSNIVQIRDERPIIGSSSSSLSSSLIHGNLQGLTSDDHKQYLLVDGSRPMEGSLNMYNYNIVSAGTINDVTVETHASRHLPNGLDPLATAIPVTINASNSTGIANSFSRSDHHHAHGDHSGGTAHSEATNSIAGFLAASGKTFLDFIPSLVATKANISGQTFTGTINVSIISATTLSAATIISGNTNLYDIFQAIGSDLNKTYVQPGINIYTGGTSDAPTVNVSAATLSTLKVSGATTLGIVSATTIFSAGTDLYNIFLTTHDGNDITRVQPGTNIITGGTANNPTINLVTSPSVNEFTASGSTSLETVSATTIISGSTNLYDIFLTTHDGNDITRVQPGLNIYTGGTLNNPTVNISAATLTYLSATTIFANTLNAGAIQSGGTDLYNIFLTTTDGNDITRVQPGSNILTGGTPINPIINLDSSPSVNNFTVSGATSLQTFTGTTALISTINGSATSGGDLTLRGTSFNLTSGAVKVLSNKEATSTSNASFYTYGGAGIAKKLYLGGALIMPWITGETTAISISGSIDNYLQLNVKNNSNGTSASSDFVATADNGSESDYYIDMGINGSGFAGYLGLANDSYLYSKANNLWIGNVTPGKNVSLFTDGTGSSNVRIVITSAATQINNLLTVTSSTSLQTLSATTILSAGTDLYNIFVTPTSARTTREVVFTSNDMALNTATGIVLTPLVMQLTRFNGTAGIADAGISFIVPNDYYGEPDFYFTWRASVSGTTSAKTYVDIYTGTTAGTGSLTTTAQTLSFVTVPINVNTFLFSPTVRTTLGLSADTAVHLRIYRNSADVADTFTGTLDMINFVFKYKSLS